MIWFRRQREETPAVGAMLALVLFAAPVTARAQDASDPEQTVAQNSAIVTGPVAELPAWCLGESGSTQMLGRIDDDTADDFVCHRKIDIYDAAGEWRQSLWTARSDREGRFRKGRTLGYFPCNSTALVVPFRRSDGRLALHCMGPQTQNGAWAGNVFGSIENLPEYDALGMAYSSRSAPYGSRLVLGRHRGSAFPQATILVDTVASETAWDPFLGLYTGGDKTLVREKLDSTSYTFTRFWSGGQYSSSYGASGLMPQGDAVDTRNALMIEDFDNDGRTEILFQHRSASAFSAARQAGDVWGVSLDGAGGTTVTREWSDRECTGDMQPIRLRNNGRVDVVCSYGSSGSIWTARTIGSPATLQAWSQYAAGECPSPGVVVVGDFTGDGYQDVACVRESGEKRVIRTNPANFSTPFAPETWSPSW